MVLDDAYLLYLLVMVEDDHMPLGSTVRGESEVCPDRLYLDFQTLAAVAVGLAMM